MRIACRSVCLLVAAVSSTSLAAANDPAQAALLTVAEKSGFKATARYDEIVALLDKMAEVSPLVRRADLGKTVEGRTIPVIIIADPPLATAEAARQEVGNGKLLILAIGNIHAGEVDGKEALPMLARELSTTANHPLLKDLIVALAPIYNADGNERVSKDNRPGQIGPEEGMGRRENAAGLDLNRDFIKLEAPETRGLVRFLNEWDPAVFIDTHTTNGCFHRYLITYEGPKAPAGSPEVIRFVRDEMLPQVARDVKAKYGVAAFVYGDFNRAHSRWDTYPALARYGTSYVGLRNRISILSEGYSYAPYKDRVLATRDFVKACLEYAAANKARIRKLLIDAGGCPTPLGWGTEEPKSIPENRVALRTEAIPAEIKIKVAGYVEEQKNGKTESTGMPRDYDVEIWNRYKPTVSVQRPYAYLVPAELSRVVEVLRWHGVRVEAFQEEAELSVEVYRIDVVEFAKEPFQNHRLASVNVTPRTESRRAPRGTIVVRTDQPLGALAVYLLEPQSEDGLVTWNFFDEFLKAGQDFPVVRLTSLQRVKSGVPHPSGVGD